MPSYRELLAQVKGEIDEIDAREAAEALDVRRAAGADRRPRAGRVRAGRDQGLRCTSRAATSSRGSRAPCPTARRR